MLQLCKMTGGPMHRQLTIPSEAGPLKFEWIQLAQNRSGWWVFVDTVENLDQLVDYWLLQRTNFYMRQPASCCGGGWGYQCFTFLQPTFLFV